MIARITRAILRRVQAFRAVLGARQAAKRSFAARPVRRILVVCYGNIYRSPFVGQYLRQKLGERAEVRTAGFHPVAGRAAPERHVRMSLERAVDLSMHRSSRVTAEDLAWADIVILMDRHNWTALDAMGADRRKLVWLGALGSGAVEIEDPYDRDDRQAHAIIDAMEHACDALVERLNR